MLSTLSKRSVVAVGAALLVLGGLTVGAAAVSGLSVTELTNSEVESGQSATHTLTFEADGISADGAMDTVYIQLPDTYAGNLSFSTAAYGNQTSGATVPISSSTTVVDGPDDDGVQETLRTGISHDADYATDAINATYEFSLSHPSVMETTSYDVSIMVNDSQTESADATASDAITVVAGDSMATTAMGGDMDETTTEPMDGMTTDSMDSMTTESMDGMTTESMDVSDEPTTTSGDGPGFTAVLAVLGLLAGSAFLARRN